MKNHRFLWLRNRTIDNRKCEKARNIKEKRTIEMFNTASNLLVAHHSSANVNFSIKRTYKREDNKPRKIKVFRGFLYSLTDLNSHLFNIDTMSSCFYYMN